MRRAFVSAVGVACALGMIMELVATVNYAAVILAFLVMLFIGVYLTQEW